MIFPYIKFTNVYNDDNAEKYEKPVWFLPELIEYFSPFEIGYNGTIFTVKEDDKEIKRRIKAKLDDLVEDDKLKGE